MGIWESGVGYAQGTGDGGQASGHVHVGRGDKENKECIDVMMW